MVIFTPKKGTRKRLVKQALKEYLESIGVFDIEPSVILLNRAVSSIHSFSIANDVLSLNYPSGTITKINLKDRVEHIYNTRRASNLARYA